MAADVSSASLEVGRDAAEASRCCAHCAGTDCDAHRPRRCRVGEGGSIAHRSQLAGASSAGQWHHRARRAHAAIGTADCDPDCRKWPVWQRTARRWADRSGNRGQTAGSISDHSSTTRCGVAASRTRSVCSRTGNRAVQRISPVDSRGRPCSGRVFRISGKEQRIHFARL